MDESAGLHLAFLIDLDIKGDGGGVIVADVEHGCVILQGAVFVIGAGDMVMREGIAVAGNRGGE